MSLPPIEINPNTIHEPEAYLRMTEVWAMRSKANRLQVGALIVKEGQIISDGYNGMPKGMSNVCEQYMPIGPSESGDGFHYEARTRPEVLHAEANAIAKLAARGGAGAAGATLYCTHAPCIHCAKLIHQAGISRVIYRNTYRETEGLDFLDQRGVQTCHLPKEQA